ncbi:MAG: hypothetical protein IPM64_09080 [Phycisphaerales bacterium]|nr:hypothetical protein [Phycisphaerales bacterium]
MSIIESQVRRTRRRMTLNGLMERLAWLITGGAAAWSLMVLVDRAISVGLPVSWIAAGVASACALGAIMWAWLRRATPLTAAIALDAAAQTRERVSSVIAVDRRLLSSDPFAGAMLRDAERVAGGVNVARAVPLRAPASWPWSVASVVTAALLFFLMPNLDLLARAPEPEPEAAVPAARQADAKRVSVAVNQQLEKARKLAEENPALAGMAEGLAPLELPEKGAARPEDVARDAVKVLDRLAEKLEQHRNERKFTGMDQARAQLPQLERPAPGDPAAKLTEALREGDMQKARDELKAMQERVAEAARKADAEAQQQLQKMQESLEKLSEQMNKLSNDENVQKDIQNKAGLSEEAAKKLMEELSKLDPKDLQKELQKRLGEKGLSEQQLKELAEKIMQNEQAKEQLKELANKMAQAAQQMKECQGACQKQGDQSGQKSDQAAQQAGQALGDAAGQLSDMEMAEQMMGEMEAQLAELDQLRKGMNDPGDQQGFGKQKPDNDPNGTGPQYGLGMGPGTGKERRAHQMKTERVKPQITGGEIIGQMLFDGPQVKGQSSAQVRDAVIAAVRDATDAINRDEVQRQYERAVREYFDGLAGLVGDAESPATPTNPAPANPAPSSP